MGRPKAGSDEGGPEGFLGVGNRPTGVRWQRDSSTHRHYEIAPSSVTFGASFPPRGSLRAMLRRGDYYNNFLHKPHRACQSLSPGGKVGRPEAGSDEGGPGGFLGVGNRPTGVRWQRDSSTHRHYKIAPSSVTFGASFPPRGSLRALLCWGFCYGCFLLSSVFISRISVFFIEKI